MFYFYLFIFGGGLRKILAIPYFSLLPMWVSYLVIIIIQLFYELSKNNLKNKVGTVEMGEKLG